MITKAAVARGAGAPLAIETLSLDEPGAGEVLVRLVASGMSRGDLDAMADPGSPFPFVPGAEGAGLVERVGPAVAALAAGDAVVLLGEPCPARAHPFGEDGRGIAALARSAFATHCLCPAGALAKVAAEAPLELLAGLGDEARAAVAAVLEHANGKTVVVVAGAGAAGLAALAAALASGARTAIVADPDPARRALASELGAALAVHTDDDLAAVVASLTGAGADLAIDTTGHHDTMEACLRATRPGGVCGSVRNAALLGDAPSEVLDFAPHDAARAIAAVAAWHADGRFPIERWISFFPFEHVNDALAALAQDAVVKPVIRFLLGPFEDLDRAGAEGAAAEVPADAEPAADPAGTAPAPVSALD